VSKKIDQIKVLNVAQPHAHDIIFNGKNVENRSGACNFVGTIAIYASKTLSNKRFEGSDVKIEDCTFGAIIGFADLVECITDEQVNAKTKKWFMGPYGYVLENMVSLPKPIEVKPPQGAVIWWSLAGGDLNACLEQIDASKIKPIKKNELQKNRPVPKTSGRLKMTPTKNLSVIVGDQPINFKQAFNKVVAYINSKNLCLADEPKIKADEFLKPLFGKNEINDDELKDIVLNNLNAA